MRKKTSKDPMESIFGWPGASLGPGSGVQRHAWHAAEYMGGGGFLWDPQIFYFFYRETQDSLNEGIPG